MREEWSGHWSDQPLRVPIFLGGRLIIEHQVTNRLELRNPLIHVKSTAITAISEIV